MRQALATIALAVAGGAVIGAAAAQSAGFAAPVRLKAGDEFMGENRLYPSPVFHDVNGDGRLDVVVGDLRGLMTVALRLPGDGPARFGAEEPLNGADGKALKFHNW